MVNKINNVIFFLDKTKQLVFLHAVIVIHVHLQNKVALVIPLVNVIGDLYFVNGQRN